MPKKIKPKRIKWTSKRVKTIILSVAIALVLSLFIIILTQAIYPSPKYEDFCKYVETRPLVPENKDLLGGTCATVSPDSRQECCENKGYNLYNEETGQCEINQASCEQQGGDWVFEEIRCITAPCPQGYCDFYKKCQDEYETARDKYRLTVFIISVIVGIITLSLGIILGLPSVSSGLMVGGTFLTFYGTAVYWTNLNNWLRALIMGIVLIILIWLGYKKLQN